MKKAAMKKAPAFQGLRYKACKRGVRGYVPEAFFWQDKLAPAELAERGCNKRAAGESLYDFNRVRSYYKPETYEKYLAEKKKADEKDHKD